MKSILYLNVQKPSGVTKHENTKNPSSLHLYQKTNSSTIILQEFANLWYTFIKEHMRMAASVFSVIFLRALKSLRQFLATESPLKMMTNGFYFILKALLFLRYLNFCSDFLIV